MCCVKAWVDGSLTVTQSMILCILPRQRLLLSLPLRMLSWLSDTPAALPVLLTDSLELRVEDMVTSLFF